MNLRKGMSRAVRVLAVVYWALAIYIAGSFGWGVYQRETTVHAFSAVPGWVNDTPYRIKVRDGRTIVVDARDRDQAWFNAQIWAQQNPRPNIALDTLAAAGRDLGAALAIFAVLWAIYRGLRWIALGFLDAPAKAD